MRVIGKVYSAYRNQPKLFSFTVREAVARNLLSARMKEKSGLELTRRSFTDIVVEAEDIKSHLFRSYVTVSKQILVRLLGESKYLEVQDRLPPLDLKEFDVLDKTMYELADTSEKANEIFNLADDIYHRRCPNTPVNSYCGNSNLLEALVIFCSDDPLFIEYMVTPQRVRRADLENTAWLVSRLSEPDHLKVFKE